MKRFSLFLLLLSLLFTAGTASAFTTLSLVSPDFGTDTLVYTPAVSGNVPVTINVSIDTTISPYSLYSTISLDFAWATVPTISFTPLDIARDVPSNHVLNIPQATDSFDLDTGICVLDVYPHLTCDGSETETGLDAVFYLVPCQTSFDLTATPALTVASIDDYTLTLPLTATSLTVNAVLGNALSGDLAWTAAATGTVTVSPTFSSDNVAFGTSPTKTQTFTFTAPASGDEVTISVSKENYVDDTSISGVKTKTITITFVGAAAVVSSDFTITPASVTAYVGFPYSVGSVVISGNVSTDTVNIVSTDVSTVNGLTLAVVSASNSVNITGTPTLAGTTNVTIGATVNGDFKTNTFTINVLNPELVPSPASVDATVGTLLSRTVTFTTNPSGGTITGLTVTPSFGTTGVTAAVSGTTLTFGGTPTTTGTDTFTVSALINGVAVTKTIQVIASPAGSASGSISLVSDNANNWGGNYSSATGSFTLNTSVLVNNLTAIGKTVGDISSVSAAFRPAGAVTITGCTVSASGNLVITGYIVSPYTSTGVALDSLTVNFSDGTVYAQDLGSYSNMTIADLTGSGGGSSDGGGDGGGCDALGLGFASLSLALFALKRRA